MSDFSRKFTKKRATFKNGNRRQTKLFTINEIFSSYLFGVKRKEVSVNFALISDLR